VNGAIVLEQKLGTTPKAMKEVTWRKARISCLEINRIDY
jgi:hypothetical protein